MSDGLPPEFLLVGAILAVGVAVLWLQRPSSQSIVVATAQQARAEAVDRLADTQALLRAIVENNLAAISVVDLEGREIMANAAWLELMGSSPRWVDPPAAPVREELEVAHPDGPRWVDTIRFPLIDHTGETYATCTVALDITERRAAAADLERSNTDLEQFAYIASHDLREPLRTMASFAELLERRNAEALDETGRRSVAAIHSAALRGIDLMDGLLMMARAGTAALTLERVDLSALAHEVVDNLEALRRERDGRVQIRPLPDVRADAAQVRQILQNLVGNALTYTRDGEPPCVTISGERRGDVCEITVADEGPGIAPDDSGRVFSMFVRGDAEERGTGLGLAIVRRLVERHDGEIRVEPVLPHGSAFTFTLPAVDD